MVAGAPGVFKDGRLNRGPGRGIFHQSLPLIGFTGMPTCTVTRRVHFNAAHRLYNPAHPEEWNVRVFGVCANPNYHGHNYELDVTVEGEVDPETGYVIDINILKRLIEEKLLAHLDHRNLNLDVAHFQAVNPTAENIAVYCWRVLAPDIPAGRLLRVRLWETPRIYVDYQGG